MKTLILTQSSVNGMNFRLAKECESYCEGEVEIKNCSDFHTPSLSEYSHIIMIVPEWNASFPFLFKKVIDDSGHPSAFKDKSVLLIGTSDTTFGNIMGITHLKHILEWCNAKVWSKRICIPNIRSLSFDESEDHIERLRNTIHNFLQNN